MADGKKSFVLYCDQIHAFETLSDEEAGRLIKHIFKYVNDQNPESPDRITEISFAPIKQQLKRDLKDWEETIKGKSDGGKKSAAMRKQLKEMQEQLSKLKIVEDSSKIVEKMASNSTVNVNVNDNVNVKRESTAPTHEIKDSNLFRKPTIPDKKQVWEAISKAGGNKEMAKSFYEKHESTGWFINGSPIVNITSLASRFVTNWNSNEDKLGKNGKINKSEPTAPPLTYLKPI